MPDKVHNCWAANPAFIVPFSIALKRNIPDIDTAGEHCRIIMSYNCQGVPPKVRWRKEETELLKGYNLWIMWKNRRIGQNDRRRNELRLCERVETKNTSWKKCGGLLRARFLAHGRFGGQAVIHWHSPGPYTCRCQQTGLSSVCSSVAIYFNPTYLAGKKKTFL